MRSSRLLRDGHRALRGIRQPKLTTLFSRFRYSRVATVRLVADLLDRLAPNGSPLEAVHRLDEPATKDAPPGREID
jgi:hypothetical protein